MKKFLSVLAFLTAPAALATSWIHVETKDLLAESDLVVVGSLTGIEYGKAEGGIAGMNYGKATIVVKEVLKGDAKVGDKLQLPMARYADTILPSPGDVGKGKEGIWILKRGKKKGEIEVSHPQCFMELEHKQYVLDLLKAAKKGAPPGDKDKKDEEKEPREKPAPK